jgi:hypothetical protein
MEEVIMMQKQYSLIECTAMLFFLCMDLGRCLGASQLKVPNSLLTILFFGASIFLLLSYLKLGKIRLVGIIFCAVLFFISIFSYISTSSLAILKFLFCILIARELTYKKVISYNTKMLLIAAGIIVLSSFVGITDMHWIATSDKISYRQIVYTFGFQNPNAPPVILFALITGYNLLQDSPIKLRTILLEFIITVISFYLFESRTALAVSTAYLLSMVLLQRPKSFSSLKLFLWPFQYIFLIGTVVTIYMASNFYALSSSWQEINLLLSGRLFLWQMFVQTYGMQLFGNNMTLNTDALDNGFMYLLVYYGISMLVIYNFMFIYISRYAYKARKSILFLTIIAYEVYCFGESMPLFINYSPVLLYFATLIMNGEKKFIDSDTGKAE